MARTAKKKIRILDEGIELTDDADSIDFAGSGVTGTVSGRNVTETISSGGGSESTEDPTSGTVDGANTSFVFAHLPTKIYSDGNVWFEGTGYSKSGSAPTVTVVTNFPPARYIKSAYSS